MYKLFGSSSIKVRTVSLMPCRTMVVYQTMRLCSFCNFYHRNLTNLVTTYHQLRCSSTTNLVGLDVSVKKKRRPRTKKFAELLEVTNHTTLNKKAAVQKLNAADLSILVQQPEISMDQLHKLKDPAFKNSKLKQEIHTLECATRTTDPAVLKFTNEFGKQKKKSFKDSEQNTGGEIDTDFLSKTATSDTNDLMQDLQETQKHLKSGQSRTKPFSTTIQKTYDDKASKEELLESIVMHVQIYAESGMMNAAYDTLTKIRKNMDSNAKKFKSTKELYNVMLNAYSSTGNLERVKQIYELMKEDEITPNAKTYAILLQCYRKHSDDPNAVREIERDMNFHNFSFDDIMNMTNFKLGQRKDVLDAIRMIHPKYVPNYREHDINYSSVLLDDLTKYNAFESPVKGLCEIEELKAMLKQQIDMECKCKVDVQSIVNRKEDLSQFPQFEQNMQNLEKHWVHTISQSFDRNLKYLKEKESKEKKSLMYLHPFLEIIDKQHYIDAAMREIRHIARGSETYSAALSALHEEVGRYINKRYSIERKRQYGVIDQVENIHQQYLEWYLNPSNNHGLSVCNNRTVWGKLREDMERDGASLYAVNCGWPREVLIEIGKFLYHIILNDIKFKSKSLSTLTIPAFYTLFRNKSNYLVEQIKPHPFVARLYKEVPEETMSFDTDLLPSFAPPRPWTSVSSGGYLLSKISFVRVASYAAHPRAKLLATPAKQLFPVMDSLNNLAAVPWKINTKILDIAIGIFQKGGSSELNVPEHPSRLPVPAAINKDDGTANKIRLSKEIMQYRRLKQEMYSLWCDCLYRLSVANHFRDKIFWLPHNIDFRGRVYAVPPHLSHLTGDLGRSLLLFAKGKPLGPNGLDWIKIHVINLTGQKKGCTIQQRLDYANEILDDIIDSAERPLTGRRWWTISEEPWQTLAACMEIANALKSPKVEDYISTFPVHQDGSCNGLQHYAALGRDTIGAQSVNLAPSEYPGDVYSAVASIVETKRDSDARNSVEIAKVLEGRIKRKVIKQTVMTTVYGVTKFGAKLQIQKRLKEEEFPKEHLFKASVYLAHTTFESLRTMFESAKEIQDWLTDCARLIAGKHGETIEWITPIGLPVIQPYFKKQKTPKFLSPAIKVANTTEKPDTMKQKNAFAPNFIHSLDSTHMMLTSLYCTQSGLTFISVHDCFWTHACSVEIMNKICREQFVALHSQPILENLSQFFLETYLDPARFGRYVDYKTPKSQLKEFSKRTFARVPPKGDFDIKNVLSSVYFFS